MPGSPTNSDGVRFGYDWDDFPPARWCIRGLKSRGNRDAATHFITNLDQFVSRTPQYLLRFFLCVRAYVYIYIYWNIYISTRQKVRVRERQRQRECVRARMRVRVHVHVRVCVCVRVHVHVRVHVCVCECVYMCLYVFVCVCRFICTYIHMYPYTRTHAYLSKQQCVCHCIFVYLCCVRLCVVIYLFRVYKRHGRGEGRSQWHKSTCDTLMLLSATKNSPVALRWNRQLLANWIVKKTFQKECLN